MSVQDEKTSLLADDVEPFSSTPRFRDVWASVLFCLHLVALIVLTVYCSLLPPVAIANANEFWLFNWLGSLHGRHLYFVLLLLTSCAGIGLGFSFFVIALLQSSAIAVIWFSCVFAITLSLSVTVYLFIAGPLYAAVVSLFFSLLNVVFLAVAYRRIPFTAQLLGTVAHIVKQIPGLVVQNIVSSGFWLLYLGLFFAASSLSNRIEVLQGWHLIPMLLTFFWTQQVSQNFAHVVAAGVTASWYFSKNVERPTLGALYRAATTSFGSICFGSLIVGLLKTFDAVLRLILFADHPIINFFVRLFLALIEALVEWFNTYAFSYISIYGCGYISAAKRSWHLLMDRGCVAIVNDSFVGGVTMAASYCGGLLAGLVAVFINWPLGAISAGPSYVAVSGFVVGFASCLIMMESIEASVTTLFVCLAENPARMRELRPALYDAIAEQYPAVVNPV